MTVTLEEMNTPQRALKVRADRQVIGTVWHLVHQPPGQQWGACPVNGAPVQVSTERAAIDYVMRAATPRQDGDAGEGEASCNLPHGSS